MWCGALWCGMVWYGVVWYSPMTLAEGAPGTWGNQVSTANSVGIFSLHRVLAVCLYLGVITRHAGSMAQVEAIMCMSHVYSCLALGLAVACHFDLSRCALIA